jgi:hypothetical protein
LGSSRSANRPGRGAPRGHRQDAEDQRKDHQRPDPRRLLLRALNTLVAQLVGKDAQGIGDAGPETHALQQHGHQRLNVLQPGARLQILERRAVVHARPRLQREQPQLIGQIRMRDVELSRHALDRRPQTQPRLGTDHQQIHGIGQTLTQTMLTLAGDPGQDQARDQITGHGAQQQYSPS